MLSAFAARKAAQAGGQEHANSERDSSSVPVPSPPSEPSPTSRPVSKRKPSSQSNSPRKKKKKVKRAEGRRIRYFEEQDASEQEGDVIVIDSDEQDALVDLNPPQSFEPVSSTGKRRWSPSIPLNDSSNEEGDGEPDISDVPATMPSRSAINSQHPVLSTFQPVVDQNTFFFTTDEALSLGLSSFSGGSAAVLALAVTEAICLLGTYSFVVLHGAVSISGVDLPASRTTHHVFAPRSSALPVLECLTGGVAAPHAPDIPQRLQMLLKTEVAIVVILELRTGVEGLGRVCKTFDGVFEPSRWQRNDTESQLQLPGVHMLIHQSKGIQPFVLPSSWTSALSSVSLDTIGPTPGVYLVKGPKNSGKSTFARTLLNRLLIRYQKVAFLECDLGQSEFTPGGMVALNVIDRPIFGPSFTHPTLPNLAHYIGITTPRSSPSHYLLAVQSLLQSYHLDIQTPLIDTCDNADDPRVSDIIPLVVNTMGWTKGLGVDLNRKIQDIVNPTEIFEFETPVFESGRSTPLPTAPQNDLPTRENDARLHLLEPIPPSALTTNYSSTDHRSIAIISYFHALFPSAVPRELEQVSAMSWNTSLPLCAHPPYEVNWSSAFEKVILTGAGTEDVVPSEIERVLNGAIVGFVSCEPGTIDSGADMPMSNSSSIPYTQGLSVPSPSTSTCHGLALIRSISPTSPHMHVLTPLPPHLLAKCRVVVKGEMELPIWGMLDFRVDGESGSVAGVEKSKVPYLQWGKGEGIGGERRRVRRNIMRKGQM